MAVTGRIGLAPRCLSHPQQQQQSPVGTQVLVVVQSAEIHESQQHVALQL